MIEVEEALRRLFAVVPAVGQEQIGLADSLDRVMAGPIVASSDLPPFDNSAMDGYAVRAADVDQASAENPVRLAVRGRIAAGQVHAGQLAVLECARLFTGAPLPAGADAVVMQEDTRTDPNRPGEVLILEAAKPWENVRLRGGDIKRGARVAEVGDVITPAKIGLLAALGLKEIPVSKRPVIGILATGSELLEAGQPQVPGRIYESNRPMLAALIHRAGFVPRVQPLSLDSLKETREALERTLSLCDAVVTSGGASVGEMDFVKTAVREIGGDLQFWQVAMRPGKPFFFGTVGGKPVFGLPGNPVSAFVTFLVLVRPVLRRWLGARETNLPVHSGVLAEPLVNQGDRRHFVRVQVDAQGAVHTAGFQASHALGSLAVATGLVDVPPQTTLRAGQAVSVMRID